MMIHKYTNLPSKAVSRCLLNCETAQPQERGFPSISMKDIRLPSYTVTLPNGALLPISDVLS